VARRNLDRTDPLFEKNAGSIETVAHCPVAITRLIQQRVKQMKQPITNESGERDGRKGFDFLIGTWKIQHRRLKKRLKGCTEWEEFEGTSEVRSILGGLGNMDELMMDRASGHVQAVTVRLYNPATREWSIYWTASSHPGRMDVPMVGKFDGPRGEFYSQEVFEGRHIFNRFIWNVDSSDSCRWNRRSRPTAARPGRPTGS